MPDQAKDEAPKATGVDVKVVDAEAKAVDTVSHSDTPAQDAPAEPVKVDVSSPAKLTAAAPKGDLPAATEPAADGQPVAHSDTKPLSQAEIEAALAEPAIPSASGDPAPQLAPLHDGNLASHGHKGTLVAALVAVVVVAVAVTAVWYFRGQPTAIKPTPTPSSSVSTTDIQQQGTAIDSSLSSVDSSLGSLNSGLNDQQGDLSE